MQVLRFALMPEGFDPDEGDPIDFSDGFIARVSMPEGATMLPTVQLGTRGVLIYAVADPDAVDTDEREFFVVPNGKDLPEQLTTGMDAAICYRGTYKIPGAITVHVFELSKVAA